MNSTATALADRSGFLNKVYAIFGLALLVTAMGVYVGFQYLLPVFAANPLLMYGLFALELILVFTSRRWHAKEPLNKFLFLLFTFSSGLTVVPLIASFVLEFGGYDIIFNALFSTTVMFLAMGLIGSRIQSSLDGLRGFLFMGLIGLLVVSLIGMFIPWGNTGEMMVSGFGVLLFAGYTVVDINRLKHYPDDKYILAAMQLYLDIFNMFIFILRLTGALSRD